MKSIIGNTIRFTAIVVGCIALWAVTPANAGTSGETKHSTRCWVAQRAMAEAYRNGAHSSQQDRLQRIYVRECGVTF